jgi:adhesin/invasin
MTSDLVRSARSARPALAAALVALAACGGSDSTNPQGARAISRVSPDSQTTAAGVKMAAPLVVLVTGPGNTPLGNVAVSWNVAAGGGTVSDTVSTTDAAGHAQTTYTPGTVPAVAKVAANAPGLTGVTFTITLVAGPATALQKFGSDNPAVVTGTKLTLSVKLVDAFGNAVSGKTVSWSSAGGSVGAATSTTDTGGVASVTYTVGTDPGTYSLTATVEGIPPATFTIRAIQ